MQLNYQVGNDNRAVSIERDGEQYRIVIDGKHYTATIQHIADGIITFSVDGKLLRAYVAKRGEQHYVAFDANVYAFNKTDVNQKRRKSAEGDNSLTAAMPGQIVNILVQEGDEVKRGQPLVILEAMKMEIRVTAPADGRVNKVLVSTGQIVERGQRLIDLISS